MSQRQPVISGEPRAIRGNMFHRLLLLNRTRDRLPMKVPHKRKKQRHSNLNLGRKRQNSVRGKSLSAEKWQQDQLALEWVAEIDWHLVWKNWTLLDSYSTRINWNLKLSIQRLPQEYHEDCSSRIQEKDQFLGGDATKPTSNAYGQGTCVSSTFVVQQQ